MRARLYLLALLGLALGAVPAAKPVSGAAVPGAELVDRYRPTAERLVGAALASDHAYRRLSELCDGVGHRLSGSKDLDRAIDWAQRAMREDGLERVRLQRVLVPHWVRGEEHAELVEPARRPLAMLGLGRSIGTPPGGLTADVVEVRSFDALSRLPEPDVRGKIVLFNVPFTN